MSWSSVTIADGLIILATLLGPILAVQAQKFVEIYRETRNRKLAVFSALMTTRATRVAHDHVRALNSIDLAFQHDKEVIAKWRDYQDSLSPINATSDEKFTDLMFSMSKSLKFPFDKVMIRRVVYLPQGHVDAENMQADVQKNLRQMLIGQQDIQSGIREYLEGRRALRVTIDERAP